MRFLLGYGSCGIASGADSVLKGLEKAFENTEYKVEKVGCNGLCFAEPIVEVIQPGKEKVTYIKMTAEKAAEVIEKHLKGGNVIQEYTISNAIS